MPTSSGRKPSARNTPRCGARKLDRPIGTGFRSHLYPDNGGATFTSGDTGVRISYAVSGDDLSLFNINPSTGALRFNAVPDFENRFDGDTNNA